LIIPESDLIHTIRIYSRSVSQGQENEPLYAFAFFAQIPGLVVPRSARFDRDTRESVATDTLVLTPWSPGVKEGQWVKCLNDQGAVVLVGEITQAIDPNLIHDHLELTVRKGAAEIDV
jgi:hypothetical protein